jgi:hypothetical protein
MWILLEIYFQCIMYRMSLLSYILFPFSLIFSIIGWIIGTIFHTIFFVQYKFVEICVEQFGQAYVCSLLNPTYIFTTFSFHLLLWWAVAYIVVTYVVS